MIHTHLFRCFLCAPVPLVAVNPGEAVLNGKILVLRFGGWQRSVILSCPNSLEREDSAPASARDDECCLFMYLVTMDEIDVMPYLALLIVCETSNLL